MNASKARLKVREDRENNETPKVDPKQALKLGLKGLETYGKGVDWLDKQAYLDLGFAKTPSWYDAKQAVINQSKKLPGNAKHWGPIATDLLLPNVADLAFGAGKAVTIGKKSLKKSLKIIDDVKPPKPPSLALASVTDGIKKNGTNGLNGVNGEKLINGAKPLRIASNFAPAGWQGSVKTMLNENVPASTIAKKLTKPYHKDLKKTYQYISMDDFSKNKGDMLSIMVDRADTIAEDLSTYNKLKLQGASKGRVAKAQRRTYDNLTLNKAVNSKQIYDETNPVRKAITKTFNEVVGKEWHHIFGNKDAAEAMLSQVAQDPYIAANLMLHLKRLKLPTSGTPENIALIGKKMHRGKGGYHSYSKKLGLEGVGKKEGVLEFSTYARAIAEDIANGKGDINQLFEIFNVYKKLNVNQRALLKTKYDAQVIGEMNKVMKFIQGA